MKSTALLLIILVLGFSFSEAHNVLRNRKKPSHATLSQIKMTGIAGMYQGTYSIVTRNTGMVLDISGGNTGNGGQLIQYPTHGGNNQLWRLYQQANGFFAFQAVHSGRVLDINGCTTSVVNVQQMDWNGSDCQVFRLDAASADGSWGDWVFIRNKNSNLVLDVSGASMSPAGNVIQYSQKGSGIDNQLWAFIEIDDNAQ